MNRTIWKFELPVNDEVSIDMPTGAQILTVQTQGGGGDVLSRMFEQPCVWAMVNPDAPPVTRRFRIFGTGHAFDLNWPIDSSYVGTFQIRNGSRVFHVFELR